MPSLSRDFLETLSPSYRNYPIFLETGTFRGETMYHMEPLFKELHTIEIKREFIDKVKSAYPGNKITFHHGDSAVVMNDVVKTLKDDTIFFLDGHYSSQDTGRGLYDCPLIQEISSIVKSFTHSGLIIIDDVRLFNTFIHEDWSGITTERIFELVKSRMVTHYYKDSILGKNDRLIIQLQRA
jgi:hypothetical protein